MLKFKYSTMQNAYNAVSQVAKVWNIFCSGSDSFACFETITEWYSDSHKKRAFQICDWREGRIGEKDWRRLIGCPCLLMWDDIAVGAEPRSDGAKICGNPIRTGEGWEAFSIIWHCIHWVNKTWYFHAHLLACLLACNIFIVCLFVPRREYVHDSFQFARP